MKRALAGVLLAAVLLYFLGAVLLMDLTSLGRISTLPLPTAAFSAGQSVEVCSAPASFPGASLRTTAGFCLVGGSVAEAARLIATHIYGNPGVFYDALMPEAALSYWASRCPAGSGCWQYWQNGNLQCVQLVTAAYALGGSPLPDVGNARDFWPLYRNQPGWQMIPSALASVGQRGTPLPGDIMVWDNGGLGHVAIVLEVAPPLAGISGSLLFAQANGPRSLDSHEIRPDLSVVTWPGYRVLGFLRPHTPPSASAQTLPQSPYVQVAWSAAIRAGIDPLLFVRQIQTESNFSPDALSPAGAIGIAQFMPATAEALGVDPTDPLASLEAAARLMASYLRDFGEDEAKSLAAYNAGKGAVLSCEQAYGPSWKACLPAETQNYLERILAPVS